MIYEEATRGEKRKAAGAFAHHSSLVTRHCRSVARHSSVATAPSGQAQLEFVLSILFVLLLIFGIFEMIMLVYTYNVLADSAKEGVRYAIVHGADSTAPCPSACSPSVKSVVASYAQYSFHDVSGMTVNVNYLDGGSNATPGRVQVQVTYPYSPLLNLSWPRVTVHASAEGRIFY